MAIREVAGEKSGELVMVGILGGDCRDCVIIKQVGLCRSFLLSGRHVRWPHRMLPVMSHGEYTDGTDGRTDGRTPNPYITLSARRGPRNN